MKRVNLIILAILIMAFLTGPLNAQIIRKGIKVGLSFANLNGSDVEDTDTKTGLAAGAFIAYSFSDVFAIQPEILYMMKGTKMTETDPYVGKITATWKINYVEVPVLAKVMIPTEGNVKPNFFAGLSLGILMSSKVKGEAMGVSVELDVKDETKNIDFGMVFGAGIDFELTKGTITFDARYTLGLTSIDDTGMDEDVKNGVISIIGGFSFK